MRNNDHRPPYYRRSPPAPGSLAYHYRDRSRYTGSRYDGGDRARSRSPRDPSPYRDRVDRGSQYGDNDRRRQSAVDTRTNTAAFQSNRDVFRDSNTGREPPTGPKGQREQFEPPRGPRGAGPAVDFNRGPRGGRGGRGRGWRDDSRDRGRDREPDYRDRPHFREDRSRERERDWRDRDRDTFPRGRRPSPLGGRGRSPPGRDFRDARDPPLGVDAERARRGSRDGPLSAGSSSSDPPFGPSSFRGGGFPRGGRGRGRGDWGERGRGRGGGFYDDRMDRYGPRSRSQEGRWGGRDQEERDRRDFRHLDSARDLHNDREPRDRVERDLIPRKLDRVSHEPPTSTKDVSPPPLAPSAPAFGSVPSRQPTTADIQTPTGKAPPTGPRALTEERPVSAGHAVGGDRAPPTGPSKPTLPDGSPPIPVGPRAQQKPQQQSSHSDHHGDFERRPRSSDAQSDPHVATTDGQLRGLNITGLHDVAVKTERGTQSARVSVDRDTKAGYDAEDVVMRDVGAPEQALKERVVDRSTEQSVSPTMPKPVNPSDQVPRPTEEPNEPRAAKRRRTARPIPSARVRLPVKQPSVPATYQSSESDDDDDYDDYFEQNISKTEAELKKLEDAADGVPIRIVARYASVVHEAMLKVVNDKNDLVKMIGPLPQGFSFIRPKPGTEAEMPKAPPVEEEPPVSAPPLREESAIPTVETGDDHPPDIQPKLEEMDTEGSGLPPLPTIEHPRDRDEDVDMQDMSEAQDTLGPLRQPVLVNSVPADANGIAIFDQHVSGKTSPSPPDEGSEDRTEDDGSIYGSIEAVREYSATPPTEELPMFNLMPWYLSKKVLKATEQSPGFHSFLLQQIGAQDAAKKGQQAEVGQEYRKNYEGYLRFTLSDDPAAVRSRDYFADKPVITTTSGKVAVPSEAKPEGSRRGFGRFSTNLDVEQAIEQSLREQKEREEREARAQKEKYRTEKEAVIPPMYWTNEDKKQGLFFDTAGLLPMEKLVATWQVVPWHVNFTEEEAEKFEKAYMESPKQWGKIAKEIPNRDFGTCIQYYYAKKRELNLKDKLKKQPRKRKKGRGKQRSSALVSELGNTENETEEAQENGENGERRRPRRAAAPTWGFETNNADSDGTTPAATPGRRRAGTVAEVKNDSGTEKTTEPKKPGRRVRQPKADKGEPKVPKPTQALAPTPPATQGKGNRSRSNSRAQGPEWLSPQTPADLGPRPPLQFDAPPGVMQPPMGPIQQQPPLASPERGMQVMQTNISEMMAPPQLRPDPVPPQASVPTFDIGPPSGTERSRSAQQASSYWSVAETTDFPALLRSFGTDWGAIAAHMQTKTAVMENGGKAEWGDIALEADAKLQRGEKRPAPPAPSTGPRKRYDVPSAGHRPLAAAESEDRPLTKAEPTPASQSFTRFPVAIAQASPVPHSLAPPVSGVMAAPPVVTQAMSPPARHRGPPPSPFTYQERDGEPIPPPPQVMAQQPPQPVRISQKPAPLSTSVPPVSEAPPRPAGWAADVDAQMPMLSQQQKRVHEVREPRERQSRIETPQREQARIVERTPVRLKQEPEHSLHHQEPFQSYQPPPQRVMQARNEPISLARQPEAPRTMAPVPRPYTPPVQAQPVRALPNEPAPMHHAPPQIQVIERPMPNIHRPMPTSMQEQYAPSPVTAQPVPPPSVTPAPSRPVERKTSSLMALLNDDPPAPPKRPDISSGHKSTPPPPPQISSRAPQPPSMVAQQRREVENPGYPYSRSAAAGIPALKPPHPQSPQPQHMNAPRSAIVSPMDSPASAAEAAQRDYYSRHHVFQSHQASASNSPQSQQVHHYPPPAPHEQRLADQRLAEQRLAHSQQHSQHSPMGYQAQQSYQSYPVTQPHAASPTPQYAPHPSLAGRRDPLPPSREAWPQPQQPTAAALEQQRQEQQRQQQQQQQQQEQQQRHQQQASWPPSHQGPPKSNQPPTQSAWAAQHGGVGQPKPAVQSSLHGQQHSWSSSAPPQQQQQPHPLNLRDTRGPPPPSIYGAPHDSQSPGGGMVHPQHQHHGSLGGGGPTRYGQPQQQQQPDPRQRGGGEPGGPSPVVGQPPYARYSNTPGPVGQGGREPPPQQHPTVRSYTPVSAFDPRGPGGPPQGPPGGPPPYGAQQQQDSMLRDAQRLEGQHQMRDMAAAGGRGADPREMAAREMAAARESQQQQQQGQHPGMGSILPRQLRPGPQHDEYNRGPPPPPRYQ
ncbi:hypothetical protein B0H66DRAFT_481359 [Apodospora peruviana]|uniref:SANT domain-containing protein n=1 Tax=Apodospora peruviana TaxID=516989 RepID=A0AAE0HZB1_9PEZI|nr:hypothetical protein B0H66DRAFT_481359 [Apodospora peruviana]